MEKKQFLWDFCSDWGGNSELFPTKRDEKHQKVFFYTNLAYEDAPNGKSGFNGESFNVRDQYKKGKS